MLERDAPVGRRRGCRESVGIGVDNAVVAVLMLQIVAEHRVRIGGLSVAGIGARHVYRDRIEGGEHSDVGNYRCVVFGMAVAVGRDLIDYIDVELRATRDDRLGIFSHLLAEIVVRAVSRLRNSLETAGMYAATAADSLRFVDERLL